MSEGWMEGDNRSITIEKDAISSTIISGNGNKVVIYQYQYQLERLIESEKTPQPGEIGRNPYKGLLAFQEEDGDRYFGREEKIEELWNLFRTLHENITQSKAPLRLLTIYGPSGSGKSSLARAGLIPELARRSLPGKSQARVAVLVPGTHPVEALAIVLARVATNDPTPVAKTTEFEQELKKTNNTTDTIIYDGLRRIANVLPDIAVSPLVVLVDQFEEVYSLCEDTCEDIKERQIFIENLIHAAGDRAGGVSVIIILRSDFLGNTQRHPALNQVIAKKEQAALIPAMSEEGLRRAITKPAELAGHPLDEAVVSLLLKDTQGQGEGVLPLLQVALTKIWEGLEKGVEPVKTLKNIGGVGGALADEAQRIFNNLNDEEKKIARRVFVELVQLGEGTSDTRRRVNVNDLVSYKEKREDVKRVIDSFANRDVRLVTLSSLDGKETAEVTHEALFTNWGQMKEWLDSSRSDIPFKRRLDEAAKIWGENSRPEGSLWRTPDLDLLRKFYQQNSDDMTLLSVEFFNASVNAEEASKQAAIKAEQERERQRQVLIGGLSTGLLLLSTGLLLMIYLWQSAERGRILALSQASLALFASNRSSIDPLLKALEAGRLLKLIGWIPGNSEVQTQTIDALTQGVNWVREADRLKGHKDEIRSVSFSSDGNMLASAGYDKKLIIWDLQNHQKNCFQTNQGSIMSVSFSHNSKTIATASTDGTVKIWNWNTDKKLKLQLQHTLRHQSGVFSVAFSSNDDMIATGDEKGIVKLWDSKRNYINFFSDHHDKKVSSLNFNPKGNILATASVDKTAILWDLKVTPITKIGKLQHTDSVTSIKFSSDGQTIATASLDKTVKLWHANGTPKLTLKGKSEFTSVDFGPDDQTIAAGRLDGKIQLWNRNGEESETLDGHDARVNSVSFNKDSVLASASNDMTVILWKNKFPLQLQTSDDNASKRIYDVNFSNGGDVFAIASGDSTIKLLSLDGTLPASLKEDRALFTSVSFSPTDDKIASTSYDGKVYLWKKKGNGYEKSSVWERPGSSYSFSSVSFSPDRNTPRIAVADAKGILWLIDENGKLKNSFKAHENQIWRVKFSPDGTMIATASDDGTVKLWDLNGNQKPINIVHNKGVFDVSFNSNGDKIATASKDQTVKLWDINGNRNPLKTLKGHNAAVTSVRFSPDGKMIATASDDRTIKLWKLDGSLITTLRGHGNQVNSINFNPKGNQLISGSADGIIILWNLEDFILDKLLDRGCNLAKDYLLNNPEEKKKTLCN